MSTIRLELRKDKVDQYGRVPIRLVYQIGGNRAYFPTKKKCFPFEWDKKKQIVFHLDQKALKNLTPDVYDHQLLNPEKANEINFYLLDLRKQIDKIETRFRLDGIAYSVFMVLDALKNSVKPEERSISQNDYITNFIEKYIIDKSSELKVGTIKVYSGLMNHIKDYEKANKFKLTFENCTIAFFRSFKSFLHKDRTVIRKHKNDELKSIFLKGMNNITSAKQLSTLKTVLKAAKSLYKIEINNDYLEFPVSRGDSMLEVISLFEEEFEAICNLDLSDNKRLDQARDVFIFSCSTGLRFSDLVQLRWEHIRNQSIKMNAEKTGQSLDIPLTPYSLAIIEKYKAIGLATPIPIHSYKRQVLKTNQSDSKSSEEVKEPGSQVLNKQIKQIGKMAGIDTPIIIKRSYGLKSESIAYPKHELLSIHCGRRTFITLSLQKGIPAQVVMKLSGHTTWASFRRYVEVSEQHKRDEVAKAWGAVPILKPVKKAN